MKNNDDLTINNSHRNTKKSTSTLNLNDFDLNNPPEEIDRFLYWLKIFWFQSSSNDASRVQVFSWSKLYSGTFQWSKRNYRELFSFFSFFGKDRVIVIIEIIEEKNTLRIFRSLFPLFFPFLVAGENLFVCKNSYDQMKISSDERFLYNCEKSTLKKKFVWNSSIDNFTCVSQ
jgi:hypothetical protein